MSAYRGGLPQKLRDVLPIALLFILLRPARAVARSMLPKSTPPAGRFTLEQLRALATQTGFPDPFTAAAVAMAESGGNPGALNDTSRQTSLPAGTQPEISVGLWQINVLAHPQFDRGRLTDPAYNASAALQVSNGGTTWTPWSTYTTSDPLLSYKRFMPVTSTTP